MEERKINEQKLAPEFYVWENDHEEVWANKNNPFFVVRNGEMSIIVKDAQGDREIIRYTDRLEKFGITNDKELGEWYSKDGEDVFFVRNNPWFEIWSVKDTEFFSEPFFDLKEAIAHAEVMLAEYPTGIVD
jgi:hypothetical protein